MLKYGLWEKVLTILVLLASVLYALPNVLTKEQRENLPPFLPQHTMTLGLDLQGGAHLVLEVQTEAVIARAYENMEDEIRTALHEKNLNYRNLKANSADITFELVHPEQQNDILQTLQKKLRGVEVNAENNQVKVAYTSSEQAELKRRALEQTLEILRNRVDEFGVAEPLIQRQGDRRVIVELPGIQDVNRAKGIIGRTAQLSFHMVDEQADIAAAERGLIPPDLALLYEESTDSNGTTKIPLLIKKKADLTGEYLIGAASEFDQMGSPAVHIRFDSRGTQKFASLTADNVGKRFAIVLDGIVHSAPVIREPILGGSAQISGNFTGPEAEDLATVLRSGALPAPILVAEERTVGPTLGQDSINAGTLATAIGYTAVVVLMVLFYGWFGMVANIALVFNVLIVIALMSIFGFTLTLPGIAGIVLTIGMAVDANILIYERMREEQTSGRTPRQAFDAGFKGAFATIFDSNITSLIAAVLLFAVGSGTIKGFALTMSIGILASMFTAVMLTRLILLTWLNTARPKRLPV